MKRRTTEEFIELCKKRHNNFYIYNPETIGFVNNTSRIKVTCPIHGEFEIIAGYHLHRGKCSLCNPNSKKNFVKCNNLKYKTDEELINQLNCIHGDNYDLSNVHVCRMTDYIHPVCKKHNIELNISLRDFIKGKGCKLCGIEKSKEKRKYPIEEYIKTCNVIYNNVYDYSEISYNSLRDYIYPICPIHGKFKVSADAHLRLNCGCQKCGCGRHTFAATRLFNFIQSYFNDAVQEKTIDRLRLDIYIPSLNTAIEYQGLQHFIPIDFYGGEKAFIKQQERDKRKLEYCKLHKINLFYFSDDKRTNDLFLGEKVYRNKNELINKIKSYTCIV